MAYWVHILFSLETITSTIFNNIFSDSWNDRQQINAGSMVLLKILVFFT